MKWWGRMPWSLLFWVLSFKPAISLSSFTFIKRLFSSSSLSVIRVVSSAYLRLLIFLLAILIPICASCSPAFQIMQSAYKLNKQGDNIQPWCRQKSVYPSTQKPTHVFPSHSHCDSWALFWEKIFHVTWTTVIPISYHIFFFLFYQDMLLTQGLHICW